MGDLDFDSTGVESAQTGFDLIPKGTLCTFTVDKAELKTSINKPGSTYLNLQLSVVSENFRNRKVFQKITRQNKNTQAVKIGDGQLAALLRASGKVGVRDTAELVGLVFDGVVGIDIGKGAYTGKDSNRIDKFIEPDMATAPQAAATPKAAPAWAKK